MTAARLSFSYFRDNIGRTKKLLLQMPMKGEGRDDDRSARKLKFTDTGRSAPQPVVLKTILEPVPFLPSTGT